MGPPKSEKFDLEEEVYWNLELTRSSEPSVAGIDSKSQRYIEKVSIHRSVIMPS